MEVLLLGGVVLVGALVQWLTGMGFALVSVPALVIVLANRQRRAAYPAYTAVGVSCA